MTLGVNLRSINSAIVSIFNDPISVIFVIKIPVCPYVDELWTLGIYCIQRMWYISAIFSTSFRIEFSTSIQTNGKCESSYTKLNMYANVQTIAKTRPGPKKFQSS